MRNMSLGFGLGLHCHILQTSVFECYRSNIMTRSGTNRAVNPLKMVIGLQIRIYYEKTIVPEVETRGPMVL